MRLWRLSLLLIPGSLALSLEPAHGVGGIRHVCSPMGGLRQWGLWSRSCVLHGGFLCNLFSFEAVYPATRGLCVSGVLGYAYNEPRSCLFFWISLYGRRAFSLESVFRNLRWLEREVGELLGVFFRSKLDRRALFTPSYLYTAPLRKVFPTGGFYELVVSPLAGGLTLVRNGCA